MNTKNTVLSVFTIFALCTPQIFAKGSIHKELNTSMQEMIQTCDECAQDIQETLSITNTIQNHKETPKGFNRIARSIFKKTPCLDAVLSIQKRTKIAITFLNVLIAAAKSHAIINDEISHADLAKQTIDTIERLRRLASTLHKGMARLDKNECIDTHNEDLNKLYTTLKHECKDALEIAKDTITTLDPYQKWLTQK